MYNILNLISFNLTILLLSFLFSKFKKFDLLKILVMTITISYFFGFRSLNIGADTNTYYTRFIELYNDFEIGFTLINRFIINVFGTDHRIYFFIINFIMIFTLLYGFKLIIKDPIFIFSAWLIVSLPYSILMQVNIIRQGLALSLFILGLAFFLNKKNFIGILFFLLSTTLHLSIIIYIVTFTLTYFFDMEKSTKIFLFFSSFLISFLGLPILIFNSIDFYYFNSRLFFYFPLEESIFFFIKILFYIFVYFVIENFMIDKDLIIQKNLNLLFFLIISSGILVLHNELFSIRYLLALDFLLPPYLLIKGSFYKNKDFLLLTFLVIFLVFVFSLYSNAFKLNFNY
jgi:hypothetical protein